MGALYVIIWGVSLVFLAGVGGAALYFVIFMTIFALPCWFITNERSANRKKMGERLTWGEYFLLFLSYLGVPMVIAVFILALLFSCLSVCSIAMGG